MSNTTPPIMHWQELLKTKRQGKSQYPHSDYESRPEFQRDYDRLIFSAPFRRLQNKTQVFPLPSNIFVHNRLTHSLEVSSVGRSLANQTAVSLRQKYQREPWSHQLNDIGAIVAAACLAHDLGNPPFGHSGENAISSYFAHNKGQRFKDQLSAQQWNDLTHFEGNANTLRILTHQFNGRRAGGFGLTYATIASIVKYPFASTLAGEKSKFGFFETEERTFQEIAQELGILQLSSPEEDKLRYARHPLVFLVEAADDICYQIMDIEDAHKLKILSYEKTRETFFEFFDAPTKEEINQRLASFEDRNDHIAYLRSLAIGELISQCKQAFLKHEQEILSGRLNRPLIQLIEETPRQAYASCTYLAQNHIYRSGEVVDVEISGYRIISKLLDKFLFAIEHPHNPYAKVLLERVPSQFDTQAPSLYGRIMAVLDFLSSMTDIYALDLYRKIYGMSLPSL